MRIGYARVSTEDQMLDLQLDALTAAGCAKIFRDRGVSGAERKRDGLADAIAAIGPGDVLVVWKLDRLGRSLRFLIELIETLRQRGAGFRSISDGIDTTTPSGTLVFHIMGALAEFERALIAERTRAGMAAARRRGRRLGRPPKLTEHQITEAIRLTERENKILQEVAGKFGVERSTLFKAIKRLKRKIPEHGEI